MRTVLNMVIHWLVWRSPLPLCYVKLHDVKSLPSYAEYIAQLQDEVGRLKRRVILLEKLQADDSEVERFTSSSNYQTLVVASSVLICMRQQ